MTADACHIAFRISFRKATSDTTPHEHTTILPSLRRHNLRSIEPFFSIVESVIAIRWSNPGADRAVAVVPVEAGKAHERRAVVVAAPGEVAPVPHLDTEVAVGEVAVGTRASHETPVPGRICSRSMNRTNNSAEGTSRDVIPTELRCDDWLYCIKKRTDLV